MLSQVERRVEYQHNAGDSQARVNSQSHEDPGCHNDTPREGVKSASRLEGIEVSKCVEALKLRTDKSATRLAMMMFAWFEGRTDSANLAAGHVPVAFVACHINQSNHGYFYTDREIF